MSNNGAQDDETSNDCKLHVSSLTRNVNKDHLKEIFGRFGAVKNVDLQVDPKLNISKGFAYVEYESADDASRGQQFMDGGQIDGNKIRVTFVLVTSNRGPSDARVRRSVSPARNNEQGGRRDRPKLDDWRRGRGPGRRSSSPGRRRERSPLAGARAGLPVRRDPLPDRRRSPVRGGPRRSRSRSRSPRRRGNSPINRARGGAGRGGGRFERSRSRDRRRPSSSRSPQPYRRRGRSSSASSSPLPPRRGNKRGRSRSSSSSSYTSSSRSSQSSRSSHSRSRSR